MPPPHLNLLDVMVLLAATGAGLWMSASYYRYKPDDPFPISKWAPPSEIERSSHDPTLDPFAPIIPPGEPAPPSPPWPTDEALIRHRTQLPLLVVVPLLPLLVSWSICLAAIVFAKERGRPRYLASRPEVWVGIAAAAVLLVRCAGFAIHIALADRLNAWQPTLSEVLERPADLIWIMWLRPYPLAAPTEIGWAVAISWLSLALGRRWRRSPGALGWMGVALGTTWIAMVPLFYFCITIARWAS